MDTYDRLGISFDTNKEIDKYDLDASTFDLIDLQQFRNFRCWTLTGYVYTWIMVVLAWALLGLDVYTCVNILAFDRWSSLEVQPYQYLIAKWIFTGCILFQFVLMAYHWVWAIKTYRTRNIALVYVNSIAKTIYTVRLYLHHCLFFLVEQDNFYDWACFLSYTEIDNALQVLVADTPRQVINILTLRFYATDGELLNDILRNIQHIATTNVKLLVILLFMCLLVIIWSVFFFKFCLGMVLYIPVVVGLKERGYSLLKKYCCNRVTEQVQLLVRKHHKPRRELLREGILDRDEIKANLLLQSNDSRDDFTDSSLAYRGVDVKGGVGVFEFDPIAAPPLTRRNPFESQWNASLASLTEGREPARRPGPIPGRVPGHGPRMPGQPPARARTQPALRKAPYEPAPYEPYEPAPYEPYEPSDPFLDESERARPLGPEHAPHTPRYSLELVAESPGRANYSTTNLLEPNPFDDASPPYPVRGSSLFDSLDDKQHSYSMDTLQPKNQ